MDEKPKRRWFQFKLSTVLILTAIAAWVMASEPILVTEETKNARDAKEGGFDRLLLCRTKRPVDNNAGVATAVVDEIWISFNK